MQESDKETVSGWMSAISASLGVDLKLDDEGICSFQIGDEAIITLEISPDYPEVYIYSTVLEISKTKKEDTLAVLIKALELNAFQALTRGGSLALAPGSKLLIFCYNTPIEGVDAEMFSKILGSFYETVLALKQLILDPEKANMHNVPKTYFKV